MKTFCILVVFPFILLMAISISANIINIPGDYDYIQDGINVSDEGDTILVSHGRYYENINFRGMNIVIASQYLIDNDVSHIENTIIDGSQSVHPDTASCVLIVSGEDSTAVLCGFTLTGGVGTVWTDIHFNRDYREGGGLLIEFSSPIIKNNLIIDNEAINREDVVSAGGGGIRYGDSNPTIQNNVIVNNRGLYGAGIVSNFATGTIKNNIIYNNTGGEDYGGSGIWTYEGGTTIIENNTIIGNVSEATGGGILVWSTSATVINNIVWGNSSATGHSQICVSGGSADITYCDIQDGWDGEGNINENPVFLEENFYLNIDSPCVDAGNPDTIYYDPPDPRVPYTALWPSMGGHRNDMGAYGGPERSILPDFDTQVSVDGEEHRYTQPDAFEIVSNYPNPFNTFTTIKYTLSQRSHVKVRIYDMLGRQVNYTIDENQFAGINYHTWYASDYPSGCYFYRISIDGHIQTKKMILLK